MSAPAWSDLEALFHEALACAPADRAAFLAERCAGHPDLQAQVAALLRAHDNAPDDVEAARVTPHPQLQRGARLGPFEVMAPLGVGGMGEVYRARDTKLGREVAIKILPTIFTKDPERRARLEREAHVLAALNHPNIGAIYGFEDSGDVGALVLELIEGPTLADRLAQGALPVTDALEIASQITAALEAAHEKGIIHRDLKPANIKLRPDGAVKVLDFGLAKVVAGDGSAPDLSRPPLTGQEGVILGTLGYMSPEQARGKAADTRTDVWAFGCVLYEMLSGRLAFQRATTSETIAAVLECEPDFAALPPDTPASIRRLVRRCLQKDPRQRIRDMGDARLEITEALARPHADVAMDAAPRSRRGRVVAYAVAASVITGALGWVFPRPTPPSPAPVVRFIVTPPSDLSPVSVQNATQNVAISADGTQLAYRSTGGAIVRSLDDVVLTPLRPIGLAQPFFLSPDGRWLGFVDTNGLQKVPVAGGPAVVVTAASPPGFLAGGASWGRDDVIVFADDHGLARVSAGGGVPERLLDSGGERTRERPAWPGLLPGGQSVLFTMITEGMGEEGARLEVLDVMTGARKTIVRGASRGRYVPTGHLLYASGGEVFAVPFDVERMETQGEPVAMVTDASDNSFAVSDTGTLVYLSGTSYAANTLTWVDRQGRETPLAAPPRAYTYPRLSPDETRVALDIGGANRDIWIWDLRRESLDLFTLNDASPNRIAAWSPDGRHLAFASARFGVANLFLQAADGSGVPERLLDSPQTQMPSSITPDGRYLIFAEQNPGRGFDQMAVSLDGRRHVIPLLQTAASEASAEVSPSGRWIAYTSNESGQPEVYVRPFPDSDRERWKVSLGGGKQPLWSRDRRELFYLTLAGAMMAVRVAETPALSLGQPVKLFDDAGYAHITGARSFDSTKDGRFLLTKAPRSSTAPSPSSLVIVHNWFEELKRMIPSR